MKKNKTMFTMSIVFILCTFLAHAQSMPEMPAFQGIERGTIIGTLFKKESSGKKSLLSGQTVAIMVFQNGERVLMLHKKTDAKGAFQFKNIFKDPSFSYSLGTIIANQLYVVSGIQLEKNQKDTALDFQVGENSPYLVGPANAIPTSEEEAQSAGPQDMAPLGPSGPAPFTVESFWEHPHQKVAIILSLLVILFASYLVMKKRLEL